MATVAGTLVKSGDGGRQSGSPMARAIDRWIYVIMASWFLAITLAGFIPDAVLKVIAVRSGRRPPFPAILHVHAVLMACLILLLLAQTVLMATGRRDRHQWLGRAMFLLAPVIFVVWAILIPTIYRESWTFALTAPPAAHVNLQRVAHALDNVFLLQLRIAILFCLFVAIALKARRTDLALHKRMMILAIVPPLQAAIDRLAIWLPTTHPASPLSTDLYTLIAIAPMFLWDLGRRRKPPKAYLIAVAAYVPLSVAVYALWNSPWWQSVVPQIMGV